MNNNFSLKFKKWDILVIVIALVISSSLLVGILSVKKANSKHRFVQIAHKNVVIEELTTSLDDLQENKTITLKKEDYPSLLGDFVIELSKSKGVRAYEVECPNHTCTKQGWINVPNLPIICIPNQMRIEIVSTNSSEGGDFVIGGVVYEKHNLF